MIFSEFIMQLYDELQNLPGDIAHEKMTPYKRLNAQDAASNKDLNPRLSAVALLLYPKENDICFCLTQRPMYDGTHSGQISLPGGKMEDTDTSLKQTALRETEEEVGIAKNSIIILGELSQIYIPPSNFLVTPFVGYLDETPSFTTNHEVDGIIEPSLKDLINSNNVTTEKVKTKYGNFKVPAYNFNNKVVWGATALILSEFEHLIKR